MQLEKLKTNKIKTEVYIQSCSIFDQYDFTYLFTNCTAFVNSIVRQ